MAFSTTDDAPGLPGEDRERTLDRALLGFGVLAGPFYLALGVGQGLVREGFDFARHPLSLLANGPGGWIQTANFVLAGLMVVAAAFGIARALGAGSRACASFLAAFGLGMIAAAVFPADPLDGFPPGTPEGFPATISTTGLLHFVAGMIGFLCLALSALLASRPLSRRDRPALSRFSLLAGLSVLVGFFGGMFVPIGTLGIWFAVVVGWVWLAATAFQLSRPAAI